MATLLAVGAGITFYLPWATFSYPSSFADLRSASFSLMTTLDDGGWIAHLWPDLVVLGFLLAVVSSFLDAILRPGRQAAIAEALGFGSISAGVVVALASRFRDWPLGFPDATNSLSPGFGSLLCLLLAASGAAVALVRFVSPRAFTPPAAVPVARPMGGLIPPGYRTSYAAQYPTQYRLPYPSQYGPPYPAQYAPQYAPPWAAQPQLSYDSQFATEGAVTPDGGAILTVAMPAVPTEPAALAQPAAVVGAAGEAVSQAQAVDLTDPPGTLVLVEAGQAATRSVSPGELLTVGSDPASSIVVADPLVSPRHASIERRGPGWLVRGLDIANPTWLLDATGRPHPVQGELGLRSGELLMGGVRVRLYPPADLRQG